MVSAKVGLMLETINRMLKMFGGKIQEQAAEKFTKPGDQFSPFKVENGQVAFKPYLIVENQNETVLYSNHKCVAVDVRPSVESWMLTQPPHLWKYAEETDGCHFGMTRFLVNEELLTWMMLRWA
jgi:hypothetical protein